MELFNDEYFDEIIDRKRPGDIKYLAYKDPDDVIPMWVADMDFKAPPAVTDAIIDAAKYGVFGYTDTDSSYDEAVISWFSNRFDMKIETDQLIKMPSVMFAMAICIRAFSDIGDSILICQPVYHPFEKIIQTNGRTPVISELVLSDGRYEIDFIDFEKKLSQKDVKLFLLCSPHNPVGRVWTKEELEKISELCLEYDVKIISDEIHADFVYPGNRHIPISTLSDDVAAATVTLTSPTKSFNLGGLHAANIFVKGPVLKNPLIKEYSATGYMELSVPAIAAVKAAYSKGGKWFDALLEYLSKNIETVKCFCQETDGRIKFIEPEGTYLLWLDCRALNMSDSELEAFFVKKAKLRLSSGFIFGKGGPGFMRMNIACPRAILLKALAQLKKALNEI